MCLRVYAFSFVGMHNAVLVCWKALFTLQWLFMHIGMHMCLLFYRDPQPNPLHRQNCLPCNTGQDRVVTMLMLGSGAYISTSTEGESPKGGPHRVQGRMRDWRARPVRLSIPSLSFHGASIFMLSLLWVTCVSLLGFHVSP